LKDLVLADVAVGPDRFTFCFLTRNPVSVVAVICSGDSLSAAVII
jgi:hypothetical protein